MLVKTDFLVETVYFCFELCLFDSCITSKLTNILCRYSRHDSNLNANKVDKDAANEWVMDAVLCSRVSGNDTKRSSFALL